ncbi:type VI secretion system baseplate subunit TssF [Roseateles sp. BYS180W]|uniref:Type VI secretion system baseplate subunit TssF n=1 Tax=Roseateles rivi TaxID=3299028 RepID=A0ABW7FRY7_9BURK
MDDLLPHYERELAFLRDHAADFAARHPKIAGRLMLSGDVGEDPHVERLIESFALLSARVHKRLDDDFPLFTESFLEVLYPHYLRPFPSCAIARFDAGEALAQLSRSNTLPRGTLLQTRPLKGGVTCKFRTVTEVRLVPLTVQSVQFRGAVIPPKGVLVPTGSSAMLSLTLSLSSPLVSWATLADAPLRFYLEGEASQVAALREALLGCVNSVFVQAQGQDVWCPAPDALPRAVGFAEEDAIVPTDARTHPAYRLLTEYFAFPEKFNFVDLPLPTASQGMGTSSITLHYVLSGLRSDSDEARLLETLTERNFLSSCAPVVNLFKQRADPIRLTHQSLSYPVLPDGRRAHAYEVYSIDQVQRVRQTVKGEQVEAFKPFYSLQHDEYVAGLEQAPRYWHARRNEDVAQLSPGYETELSIVDIGFDPAQEQTDTLSVEVTATNRDLPAQLQVGSPGGDLFIPGGGLCREIRMLRRPTQAYRFSRGQGALWKLISHLSLNHLSLTQGGIEAIKELLRLYDLPGSASNRRVIDALCGVEYVSASTWLSGEPFPAFVRGMEVRLTVDETHFAGIGLRLFAQVLNQFLGLYVTLNSFVQLKVVSERSGQELMAFEPRSGEGALL